MRREFLGCIALAASLVLAACAEPPATEPIPRGRQVYRALDCGRCHLIAGQGGRVGPELTHVGTVAEERRPSDPEGYLRESVSEPGRYVVPGFVDNMPRGVTQRLSQFDLDSLVAYLRSLR